MQKYIQLNSNYYYSPVIKKIVECKCIEPNYGELEEYIDNNEIKNDKDVFTNPSNVFPIRVSLFPSASCSMRCSYCYYCSGDNDESDLCLEDLDTVINYLIKNAKIRQLMGKESKIDVTLTGGGEPTFNWGNFTYFVDSLKQKAYQNKVEAEVYLITNGVLSKRKIDYLCDKIDYIQISYDGNSELQNINRKLANGENSANLVEQTMYELSDRRKAFYVRSTIQPCDYGKIEDMAIGILGEYEYAVRYHIEPVQYTGRGVIAERDTVYDNDVLIREYIKTKKVILERFTGKDFFCSLFEYKDVRVSCSSITGSSPVIDNRGILFPCSDRLDPNTQSMGKIENGKVNIERGSFFEEQYKKMMGTECGTCSFFSLCGGGCFSSFKRDEEGRLLPEGKAKCDLLIKFWHKAYSELAEKHVFLDMRLKQVDSLSDWNIYAIKTCRHTGEN